MLTYDQHRSGAWAAHPTVCVKEASPRCAPKPQPSQHSPRSKLSLSCPTAFPNCLYLGPCPCLTLSTPQSCQPCAHPPPFAHRRTLPWTWPQQNRRARQVLRSSGCCWWATMSNWRCFTHQSTACQQHVTHVHHMGANLLRFWQFCLLELHSPLHALFLSFLYLVAKYNHRISRAGRDPLGSLSPARCSTQGYLKVKPYAWEMWQFGNKH